MDGTVTAAPIEHIELDEHGRARLKKSGLKVHLLIFTMLGQEWTAEEMLEQYHDVSLAEVYAMLAYYHDHKETMDAERDQLKQEVHRLRAETLNSPLRQRLRAMGKIK